LNADTDTGLECKRVFLSYSRTDWQSAKQIVDALKAAGLTVFWDEDIPKGANWQDKLQQELYQCDLLLVLVGSQGVSGWVKPEVGVGLNRSFDRSREDNFTLLGDTEAASLPPFLSLFNSATVRESDEQVDLKLIDDLRKGNLLQTQPIQNKVCPYPGLGHYTEELATYFFGRQQDLYELLAQYGDKPRHAGLLPALRNGWLETGDPQIELCVLDAMRPGEHPVSELAATLVRSGLVNAHAEDLRDRLMKPNASLRDVLSEIPSLGQ